MRATTIPQALYTMAEAADYLRLSRARVYVLIKRGDLRKIKLGGKSSRLTLAELEGYVRRCSTPSA